LKRVYGGSGDHHDEPIVLEDEDDDRDTRQTKRARGGSQQAFGQDDDIVELGGPANMHQKDGQTDPISWPEEQELDPKKMVDPFRVNITRLSKHDEYQVLYFPLTDPLTEYQKRQRVVVTSERVVL